MADIAASDVTVSILNKRRVEARNYFNVKLVFGDGVLTYPAGGIPLSKAKLGCPNALESLRVYGKGTSGYEFSYDAVNEKLVLTQSPAHAHSLLIKGGQAAAGTSALGRYATEILGKEAATDATILAADSATKGGVLASTAAPGSQPSAVAIAAQEIRAEVIGW